MSVYDAIRAKYRPEHIKFLIITESPPPPADIQSSRQFYYIDRSRTDDRLYANTMRALYSSAAKQTEEELQTYKEAWLRRFHADGWYMIEALTSSQPHQVTKHQRQERIRQAIPQLIKRVAQLVQPDTKIILVKSNVYDVAAEPLRDAGYHVLNHELVDYPGQYNQKAYREKLAKLAKI
jgi:hypothetical protein